MTGTNREMHASPPSGPFRPEGAVMSDLPPSDTPGEESLPVETWVRHRDSALTALLVFAADQTKELERMYFNRL